ncbi:MAG: hypothetical protein HYV59_08905 [Planctomycetes bacterium]|nr:hypothetical protein [Planctomycetota bacterium]
MKWLWVVATVVYLVPFIVFGSEVGNRFVDFNLEDPQSKKHSQTDMEGKITVVILQSRYTLDAAVACKKHLKELIQGNQKVQMISIMDLRRRPSFVPKLVLKKKISGQDPTSKEIPFLLDWEGDVTKLLGGDESKCMVLIVDPGLKIVYKQKYKKAVVDSEIKPLLAELSQRQK